MIASMMGTENNIVVSFMSINKQILMGRGNSLAMCHNNIDYGFKAKIKLELK